MTSTLAPADVLASVHSEGKAAQQGQVAEPAPRILLVDDEPHVLNALRRALRDQGYEIYMANEGVEAIRLARELQPAIVVCDMRMPGLTGVDVLESIAQLDPDCARVLLTGYTDISSTIEAINQGHVHRYVSKPWNDDELKVILRGLLQTRQLRRERDQLAARLSDKNRELAQLNHQLEEKVTARTSELEQINAFMEQAHRELRAQFHNAVKVIAAMVGLRFPPMVGHSQRVAEMSRAIAQSMGLSPAVVHDIYIAGLLHDVGKMAMSDHILTTPITQITAAERALLMKHPAKGQMTMMSLTELNHAGVLVRHHHERFDGQGFPDGLSRQLIPMGARILAVAEDYDELQQGWLAPGTLKPSEAQEFIEGASGKRYDPDVVQAFVKVLEKLQIQQGCDEILVNSHSVHPQSILSRDLSAADGLLLLAKDHVISEGVIDQLLEYERHEQQQLAIYVYRSRVAPGGQPY